MTNTGDDMEKERNTKIKTKKSRRSAEKTNNSGSVERQLKQKM